MNKNWLCMCVMVVVVLTSCQDNCKPSITSREHSGFSYACNMQSPEAVLQFEIYSETECAKEVLVRCCCRFDYDSDACVMEYQGKMHQLFIPPDGQWNFISLPVVLKKGINYLQFKRVHPMKDDVLIDYIEIR